jgi:hypothetical protein
MWTNDNRANCDFDKRHDPSNLPDAQRAREAAPICAG